MTTFCSGLRQPAPKPPIARVWHVACSCDELADTTGLFDALLGNLGEQLGADDAGRLDELALSADLEEAL